MTTTKQVYTKEFSTAVDTALANVLELGTAITLIYRRPGKLDIRVKIETTPPLVGMPVTVYQAPP